MGKPLNASQSHAQTSNGNRPLPPKGLAIEPRRHWERIADLVDEAGLLSRLDADCLTLYVTVFEQWQEACKAVKQLDPTDKQFGRWLRQREQSEKAVRGYLKELGLSPNARKGLRVEETETIDPRWAELEAE